MVCYGGLILSITFRKEWYTKMEFWEKGCAVTENARFEKFSIFPPKCTPVSFNEHIFIEI
jgi:hypothetical protein